MSKSKESDDFGNRMKSYEATETSRRLNPQLPVYARIDGRAFSTFTRGMDRPFDARLTTAMIETTKHLVHKTDARIGYTQSDEISLLWLADKPESDIFFSGKILKMASVLASMAAAKFILLCPEEFRHRMPHFDCRVCQLPTREEAANMFLWRAMDAQKNAVSQVAHHFFSHRNLQHKNQQDMHNMLVEKGVCFSEFPPENRFGSFVRRVSVERELTPSELDGIPEEHRPRRPVTRSNTVVLDMPPFKFVANRAAVIFDGAKPVLKCE